MSAKLIFLAFAAIACQVNGQFSSWNQGFRPGFLSNFFNMMYGQQQQQQQPQQQYPFMFNSPIGQFLWPQRPQIIPAVPSIPPHFRPTYRPPFSPFYGSSEEQDQGSFVGQPGTFDIQPEYVEPDLFDTASDNALGLANSFEESQDVTSEEIYPDNDEVIQPVFPEGVQISPPHPGNEQLEEFPEELPETHQVIQPIYIPDEGLTFTGESDEEEIDESPEIGLQVEEEPEESDVSEDEAVPQEAVPLSEQPLLQAPLV